MATRLVAKMQPEATPQTILVVLLKDDVAQDHKIKGPPISLANWSAAIDEFKNFVTAQSPAIDPTNIKAITITLELFQSIS